MGRHATPFWDRVNRVTADGCWPWLGAKTKEGYGVLTIHRPVSDGRKPTSTTAHRRAFELTNGPIPPGLEVLHSCDNPPCCNPSHLSGGTHKENIGDMIAKGRGDWQRGHVRRFSPRSRKLSDAAVRGIRILASGDHPLHRMKIAILYDVSESHVKAILNGSRKAHVVPEGDVDVRNWDDRPKLVRRRPAKSL